MDDRKLLTLLRMSRESSQLVESDMRSATSADPRKCLSMHRLHSVAGGECLLPVEAAHLAGCRPCTLRLHAFGPSDAAYQSPGLRNGRPAAAIRRLAIWAIPIAACLAIWLIWRPITPRGGLEIANNDAASGARPRATGEYANPQVANVDPATPLAAQSQPDSSIDDHASQRPVSLAVDYTSSVDHVSGNRSECYRPVVEQRSTLVALMATWDAACDCAKWRVHLWDDGNVFACVDAGQMGDVTLSASGHSDDGQNVVFAASHDGGGLPAHGEEADALIKCLNANELAMQTPPDSAALANSVQACLGSGVQVFPAFGR